MASREKTSRMPSRGKRILAGLPPFLLGGILSAAFFGALAYLGLSENHPIVRYTSGHWLAIAEMGVFFWGMSALVFSLVSHWRETASLRHAWLPDLKAPLPPDQARDVLDQINSAPPQYRATLIGRRLRDVVSDVCHRHAADRIDQTLREFADRDKGVMQSRLGIVRIFTGILPVVGLLGSALLTAMTLSNVSQTELESSIPAITASLAVALDPTILAVSLSLMLLLSMYIVERQTSDLLAKVDDSARTWLADRFITSLPEHTPFLAAVHASSEQTVQLTRALMEQQTELWSHATTRLHQRLEELASKRDTSLVDVMNQLLEQWKRDTNLLETSHRKMDELRAKIERIGELLIQRTGDERALVAAQQSLADNLKMLKETHSFDEALQSITAAVHLLTIRAHAVSNASIDSHRESRAA